MFYGLSLLPLVAAAAPNDCRHVPEGVLCTLPAFNLLMDAHSMCRADLKVANLRLGDLQSQLTLCEAKVAELSAKLPCPPPPAPPDPMRFVGGYALGLLGAVSVAAAVGFPLPEPVRLGMGLAGVAGIGVGVVLVLP